MWSLGLCRHLWDTQEVELDSMWREGHCCQQFLRVVKEVVCVVSVISCLSLILYCHSPQGVSTHIAEAVTNKFHLEFRTCLYAWGLGFQPQNYKLKNGFPGPDYFISLRWEAKQARDFLPLVPIYSCLTVHASLLLRSEANFFFVSVGTLQATAVVQEQDGEELRTLHLEEVVQEAAGEWQTLTNVFWRCGRRLSASMKLHLWRSDHSRVSVLKLQVLEIYSSFF